MSTGRAAGLWLTVHEQSPLQTLIKKGDPPCPPPPSLTNPPSNFSLNHAAKGACQDLHFADWTQTTCYLESNCTLECASPQVRCNLTASFALHTSMTGLVFIQSVNTHCCITSPSASPAHAKFDVQQQAAAAAAAAAARAEEEQKAVRPQRRAPARPVRIRAASPSSDSEELEYDSPSARYKGMQPGRKYLDLKYSMLHVVCCVLV